VSASTRLSGLDWIRLIAFWLLGCGISFAGLVLLLQTLFEPGLLSESMVRIGRSVVLVETVLERLPPERLPYGVLISRSGIGPEGPEDGLNSFDRELQAQLQRQFGLRRRFQRDRQPFADPWGGYWIRLQVPERNGPVWLYQPERLASSSAWFLPLLRTGAVFMGVLLGTVAFLRWRVERPFDRVLRSLPDTTLAPLPLLPERGIAPLQLLTMRINRLLERINDEDSSRRALLRGLAHDLAGPQSRLRLRLESLEQRLEPRHLSAASALQADLEQLGQLTEQITLLADRAWTPVQMREFALDDYCRRLAATYQGGAVQVEMRRLLVRLDILGLERSLRNLIDNALEHGRAPVRLSAFVRSNVLHLRVEDHGCGLSTPTLPTISSPPPAADRGRRVHRGLGLQIVSGFCHDNGGRLLLESSSLGGLRAELLLQPTAANPLFV
jgi:signal transduction histidine kinase